jgi:hypothetical protein
VVTYWLYKHTRIAPMLNVHDALHQVGCYVLFARWSDERRTAQASRKKDLVGSGKRRATVTGAAPPTKPIECNQQDTLDPNTSTTT